MTSGLSAIAPPASPRPLRDLWRLAGPYWNCERRAKVRGATLLFFLLTVAQVGLAVWGNYWNRALFDALEQRTARGVLLQVGVFAIIFVLSILVTAAHLVVKRWLQLDWREWITRRVVGEWLADGRHYRLRFTRGEHDNPDQRIAEDIRIATEVAIALAHTLVYSLLILVMFADILWSISGSIVVPGTNVAVPGYLVPLAFLYAAVGSVLGWLLGRPLVSTTNALQSAEATFRFGLSRAREHSESIALLQGEPRERAGSDVRFRTIVHDWDRQSLAYMGLVAFGTAYGALLPVFPILVAAPQYIAGVMSLGVLMQAAQAFQSLTSALSWPVNNIGEIARCRASADRVLSLHEDLGRLDGEPARSAAPRLSIDRSGHGELRLEGVALSESDGRPLLDPVDAVIGRGERVAIRSEPAVTGPLFRALGGLWPWGAGRIVLPADGEVDYVPQRPFLPQGSLRDALCYPRAPDSYRASVLRQALEVAGLGWLAERLDDEDDWEQALPLHAQQRLAFARVLLHRPAWVLMEEATDGFDGDGEREMLELLQRELPGVSIVAIRYRNGERSLYGREIVLKRASSSATGAGLDSAGAPASH
jgi:putative ATP-binding cassette transporter